MISSIDFSKKSTCDLPDEKPVVVAMSSQNDDHDSELNEMREKLIKMQEEARKLKQIQETRMNALLKCGSAAKITEPTNNTVVPKEDETKSIHIANIHFSASEKQISEHFSVCGKVCRVTILKDPYSGHPKG